MPPVITPSKLQIGVDVPWVTSWSEETRNGVGPCPTVDGQMAVLQRWKPGLGKPQYSRNHLRRQRDSVRAMLCPMCGKLTERRDRWSQTGHYAAAGDLRLRGFGEALPKDLDDGRLLLDCGAIAPLHGRCAEASLERCPYLGGLPDRELKPFPEAWVVVPLYTQAMKTSERPISVVTFLQLVGVTETRDRDWRDRVQEV